VPAILRLDPSDSTLAMLLPFLAERVRLYAAEHEPRIPAETYTAMVMGRLWARDPSLLALGIVDTDKGFLVGHVLAELITAQDIATGQSVRHVSIAQKRADGNVGDAVYQALDQAGVWGAANGASLLELRTKRDSREYEKRLGYTHGHHVLYKALGTDAAPR